MKLETKRLMQDTDPHFKVFHELMANKIREILLVSTPYDAWVMEEDCRLSERIIHEYRGLNLSHPPRLTWVSTADDALSLLDQKRFDLVIAMPQTADMDASIVGQKIKARDPDLPVVLLAHDTHQAGFCPGETQPIGIDRTFLWTGNTNILLAIVKHVEDRLNVADDTQASGIRVILYVDASSRYMSSLLPILYKELVVQTQALLDQGLNEEHRLLTMRARPKIIVADSYEEALGLYEQFEPYVLGVISDVQIPRNCAINETAGAELLSKIKDRRFDIPLLLMGGKRATDLAQQIPTKFVDKHAPSLISDVRKFIQGQLGFGEFVFKMPDGREVGRAFDLYSMEKMLQEIPAESLLHHAHRNDFSRWLFARSEIILASKLRPITDDDFKDDVEARRRFLVTAIQERRHSRQTGIVVNYDASDADIEADFLKIGKGSIGGKARGLAFVMSLLHRDSALREKFAGINITVPQTLVLTSEGFEAFVEQNDLRRLAREDFPDEEVAAMFLGAQFPEDIREDLEAYLTQVKHPLAVRSSSLLEDAQFRAYAGLYKTYMLANDHEDLQCRLEQLINAVKLVYASTYFRGPKSFSKRVGHRTEEEQMAVIIQQLVGESYGDTFYPAVSGVAQSHNYYPYGKMKPEEGIATVVMGLGRMVVEGEKSLRFSPRYPELLPQRASVEDILKNSQRFFYALRMGEDCVPLGINESATLDKREITDAVEEPPMQLLASTYIHEEHRIRDTTQIPGYRVLTFAQLLKYKTFPLADILNEVLALCEAGMGCPVEIEFSMNLCHTMACNPEFDVLQVRPMTARAELMRVDISAEEEAQAFCRSSQALGNAVKSDMADILFIKPDSFEPAKTPIIAREIGQMNARLLKEERPYLLIGPGRWGSADRWLGVPVTWPDICGVGAIVETAVPDLKADPSQGSHFFHNITTLGINYLTVAEERGDALDWEWLTTLPAVAESTFVRHVRLEQPLTLKVDGSSSRGVIVAHP